MGAWRGTPSRGRISRLTQVPAKGYRRRPGQKLRSKVLSAADETKRRTVRTLPGRLAGIRGRRLSYDPAAYGAAAPGKQLFLLRSKSRAPNNQPADGGNTGKAAADRRSWRSEGLPLDAPASDIADRQCRRRRLGSVNRVNDVKC